MPITSWPTCATSSRSRWATGGSATSGGPDLPGNRRRTDPAAGRAALTDWLGRPEPADPPASSTLGTAVRWTLELLAERAPGGTVEVRVPPYGVVQCVEGQRHKRGTPPNVVETDAQTWLGLATGTVSWADAVASGRVSASGNRADLSGLLPLVAGTVEG